MVKFGFRTLKIREIAADKLPNSNPKYFSFTNLHIQMQIAKTKSDFQNKTMISFHKYLH